MKSSIKRLDAETDGPGKFGMRHQKFRDLPGRNLPDVNFTVSLKGAARFQDRHPLNGIDVAADFFPRRQKEMIFDVENARGVVGAFEKSSNANEIPAFAMRHGRVDNSLHEMRAGNDAAKEFVGTQTQHLFPGLALYEKVETIDVLQHRA